MAKQQQKSATKTKPPARALASAKRKFRLLYLLTTFPTLSETFVRREVRALSRLNVDLKIYSLWGGGTAFEFQRVNLFPKETLLTLFWWWPYWLVRRPRALFGLARDLLSRPPGSFTDFAATYLGIGFALCYAHHFRKGENRPELIHAGWAATPATAAKLLSDLIDVPFTFQANAYDIFLDGGDWLLPAKLRDAAFVMTGTEYARNALIERGAPASMVTMIRRGVENFPTRYLARSPRTPLHLLSIGRLVEKKGYHEQLELLAQLKAMGLSFEARIVGAGPLNSGLAAQIKALDLRHHVRLLGQQTFTACRQQLQWADVFLFTGKVSQNGDRDGLPNVICEAMACGVPVVSTPVSGVPEAIRNGKNGVLLSGYDPDEWGTALLRLRDDDEFYLQIRDNARAWVQENFAIEVNVKKLATCFATAALEGRKKTVSVKTKKTVTPSKKKTRETAMTT